MTLSSIPVSFDQEAHTYTNTVTGEILQGITGTLLKRAFPDKYRGIPQHILDNAASRGSMIHEQIELMETIGVEPDSVEAQNYAGIKKRECLTFLASEYTVSDMEHYASNIDIVFSAGESSVHIADIKTTSKFDRDSVSWQLSIYAYLFSLNNPDIAVDKLYGIWLRGDIAELIEVEKRPAEEVRALIEADLQDIPFEWTPTFPEFITSAEDRIVSLTKRIKAMQEELDMVRGELFDEMKESGEASIDTGKVLYTITKPSTRTSFASAAFKKDHADLYQQYTTTTQIQPTLKITIR